jgi:meso-butanediol dehydrogenase/(S,S)-butanediol dehydrogenase/diacetyl reductase
MNVTSIITGIKTAQNKKFKKAKKFMELEGKTIVITGAGSGIGRATALTFAEAGSQIVCCGRRAERLQETVQKITDQGRSGLAVKVDVTNHNQVQNMVTQTLTHFGGIDVLFNCAGSFGVVGGVWEIDSEAWWRDIEVNLKGSMLCCKAVLPHMIEKNTGIIINTSGGGAGSPMSGGSGYGCSKAALLRFTDTLGCDLIRIGSSVLALAIDPGFNRTEMTELLAQLDPNGKWLPVNERLAEGYGHAPEKCAQTLVSLVQQAIPEFNGRVFNAGQDISALVTRKVDIVAGDLMTLRLRKGP